MYPTELNWSDYSTLFPLGQNANQFVFQRWWNQISPILGQLFGIRTLMDTLEETDVKELLLNELMEVKPSTVTPATTAGNAGLDGKPKSQLSSTRSGDAGFPRFTLEEDEQEQSSLQSDLLNRGNFYGTPHSHGRLGSDEIEEPRSTTIAARTNTIYQAFSAIGEEFVNEMLRQSSDPESDTGNNGTDRRTEIEVDSNASTIPLKRPDDHERKQPPRKSAKDILREKVFEKLNSESYLDLIADRVVDQLPTAMRAYKLAKQAIIGKFFIGTSAYIHSDIIKRMMDKSSQLIFLNWAQEHNLAALLNSYTL
jgi:hypothetical protein